MRVPGLRGVRVWTLATETYRAFDQDDMWTYASAVAYSVLFALFPFLLFLLALFSFLDQPGLRRHCTLSTPDEAWLETACERLTLSLRAAHRLLKVARSLADLEQAVNIRREHLAEALQYRPATA